MKNKKKKTLLVVVMIILIFSILSICRNTLPRPETDLEFWIGDRVERNDLSELQEKHGLMGGREYYGKSYLPSFNENGEQVDPEHCVVYTVTAYPDYVSRRSHITHIRITDPTVTIDGLTFESHIEDIENTMKRKGFKIEYSAGGLTARKGRYTFIFSENAIQIDLKVTNLFLIQF